MSARPILAALLCSVALIGCASSGNDIPKTPKMQTLKGTYAPPPMRPATYANKEPETFKRTTLTMTVGSGSNTEGPQQVTLALPQRENINRILWANSDLLSVTSGMVGTPREGHHVIAFKPLSSLPSTVHDVTITTNKRQIDVTVNVVPGRVRNTSRTLDHARPQMMAGKVETECADSLFSWQRTVQWAPMSVCASITSDGAYTTVIRPPNNMQGSVIITALRDVGGGGTPSIVNYNRRADGAFVVNDIWPLLRMSGDGGHVDIQRARL